MMKMGKTTFAFAAALLCIAACTPEEKFRTTADQMNILVESEITVSKTILSTTDDENYNVVWDMADKISVLEGNPSKSEIFEAVEVDGRKARFQGGRSIPIGSSVEAYFPSDMVAADHHIEWPQEQQYTGISKDKEKSGFVKNAPMYAQGELGETLKFKNIGGILRLSVVASASGVKVNRIEITADKPVSGAMTIETNDEGQPYAKIAEIGNGGSNKLVYNLKTSVEIPTYDKDTVLFHLALPVNNYKTLSIQFFYNQNNGERRIYQKNFIDQDNTGLSIKRSKITNAFIRLKDSNERGEGTLPGVFTVNANGGTVRFSKGNLQYQASETGEAGGASHWRFAENQWDIIGAGTDDDPSGNVTEGDENRKIQSKWIDYFGFGTSGFNSRFPYQADTTGNYCQLNIAGNHYDWGIHNAIENGGNKAGLWRTLSSAEWEYLLRDRVGGMLWAIVKVNGTKGLMIFPDNFTLPQSIAAPDICFSTDHKIEFSSGGFTTITDSLYFYNGTDAGHHFFSMKNQNSEGGGFNEPETNYSIGEFLKLEAAGAVFLPASGFRWSYELYDSNGIYYMSSTIENIYKSIRALFYPTTDKTERERINAISNCLYIYKDSIIMPGFGLPVRLVRDVN